MHTIPLSCDHEPIDYEPNMESLQQNTDRPIGRFYVATWRLLSAMAKASSLGS